MGNSPRKQSCRNLVLQSVRWCQHGNRFVGDGLYTVVERPTLSGGTKLRLTANRRNDSSRTWKPKPWMTVKNPSSRRNEEAACKTATAERPPTMTKDNQWDRSVLKKKVEGRHSGTNVNRTGLHWLDKGEDLRRWCGATYSAVTALVATTLLSLHNHAYESERLADYQLHNEHCRKCSCTFTTRWDKVVVIGCRSAWEETRSSVPSAWTCGIQIWCQSSIWKYFLCWEKEKGNCSSKSKVNQEGSKGQGGRAWVNWDSGVIANNFINMFFSTFQVSASLDISISILSLISILVCNSIFLAAFNVML